MKKSVRLYISGAVQGIFYVDFVKQNAEKLDVKGFLRTLEDGRIEIFLEGQIENVKKMMDLCSVGPKHSKIRNVEVKEEKYQELKSFKVLHI
jgi:acylphosphatase